MRVVVAVTCGWGCRQTDTILPNGIAQTRYGAILLPVTELDYQEIVALSEDANVSFDDVRGRAPTPEELDDLAEFADSIFYQRPLDKQIGDIVDLPIHISVRRLSRMPNNERAEILSHLPSDLAEEIVSQLPIGVC